MPDTTTTKKTFGRNMPDFFAAQRELRRLRRNIELRIEPQPVREEDDNALNPFAHEVEKTGVEISVDGLAPYAGTA